MPSRLGYAKTILVGRPKETAGLEHERLTKKVALAVFASDALSSSAYATEEILLVLIAGGAAALQFSIPIAILITCVLGVVSFSYRQTIHAYPNGGGAYIVAHDNLGKAPGLVAASAVLIDYILTVAVSVAAGVSAVVSAFPDLHGRRVVLALALVALITILNLRGVKESGRIFAVPTYGFIALIGSMLAWGLIKHFVMGHDPGGPIGGHGAEEAAQAFSFVLLLKAFSNGCTALTGVEAISDGVQAFRKPAHRNAAKTLAAMAGILAVLFIGLTVLAHLYRVQGPTEHPHRTVVALVALRVFGNGPLFLAVQAATALILILAANTSYADFPRIAAILGRDRYAPRQFMNRGDRLAYSNGIIGLAVFSSLLLIIYNAEVSRLIHLYVVGVFTAFTLSQSGMVRRWWDHRNEESRWRRYALINGLGATVTLVVLCIVVATKFLAGAWIVVVAIPVLSALLNMTNRHYRKIAVHLRDPSGRPQRALGHHVVMLVGWPGDEERLALGYAEELRGAELHCVHFAKPDDSPRLIGEWSRVLDHAPSLEIVPTKGSLQKDIHDYVRELRSRIGPSAFLTVIIPERIRGGIGGMIGTRQTFLAKLRLLYTPDVVVTDVPYQEEQPQSALELGRTSRHVCMVTVSGVHNGTMKAIEYARSLHADELHAVHVSVDPDDTRRVTLDWDIWSPGLPLEVLDSPYRTLAQPILEHVRSLVADGRTIVTVVLPEFIVKKWWHGILHNQNAIELKRMFLYEPNVVVTSVTTRLA
ncbi:MAG TPA: APC family permease [Actinomycetota bacterium]|nr:APC family permease [Actinomycetota bacterium]